MPLFNNAEPSNLESAKLGAARIRELKGWLNSTLGKLFSGTDGTVVPGGVTEAMLGTNAVTQTKIKDGEVIAGKLGANAVVGANIAAGAVDFNHLSATNLRMVPKVYAYATYNTPYYDIRNGLNVKQVSRNSLGQFTVYYDPMFPTGPTQDWHVPIVWTSRAYTTAQPITSNIIAQSRNSCTFECYYPKYTPTSTAGGTVDCVYQLADPTSICLVLFSFAANTVPNP